MDPFGYLLTGEDPRNFYRREEADRMEHLRHTGNDKCDECGEVLSDEDLLEHVRHCMNDYPEMIWCWKHHRVTEMVGGLAEERQMRIAQELGTQEMVNILCAAKVAGRYPPIELSAQLEGLVGRVLLKKGDIWVYRVPPENKK